MTHHKHTQTDRLALRIVDLVVRRPWLTILATLLLVVSAGSGLRFIEFSTNYRVFFSPQNPELVAFEEFQQTYTKKMTTFSSRSNPNTTRYLVLESRRRTRN